jgi:hypothetical protein
LTHVICHLRHLSERDCNSPEMTNDKCQMTNDKFFTFLEK